MMLSLKEDWQSLHPNLKEEGKEVQKLLSKFSNEELANELNAQLQSNFLDILSSVKKYNNSKYKRKENKGKITWQEGSTKCYSYENKISSKANIILIPSMINKSYIFDISEENSFINYLLKKNFNPYLVDWSEPIDSELNFGLEDFINKRLLQIIKHVDQTSDKPIILTGYCMGGLLASAASILSESKKIKALALLATPWNFHTQEFVRLKIDDKFVKSFQFIINSLDKVRPHIIQSIFYYLYPELIEQKFRYLKSIFNNKKEYLNFIELEGWANDGISMTKEIFQECFVDWVHKNKIYNNEWIVNDIQITPDKIKYPTFFAIPKNDKIVPYSSAICLAEKMSNKEIISPDSGHVGMIAGKSGEKQLLKPFVDWVEQVAI